jgi:hypothetical protein
MRRKKPGKIYAAIFRRLEGAFPADLGPFAQI